MNRESKFDHRTDPFSAVSTEPQKSSARDVSTYGDEVLRTAKNTRSDAYDVVTRLSQVVMRLCGSIPPVPGSELKAHAAPSGLLAEIKDANDGTQVAIGDLFHLIDILESTV